MSSTTIGNQVYTHQGIGVSAVNAEESDWRLWVLGCGGIGSGSVDDGSSGELLGGSAKARLGDAGGEHGEKRGARAVELSCCWAVRDGQPEMLLVAGGLQVVRGLEVELRQWV